MKKPKMLLLLTRTWAFTMMNLISARSSQSLSFKLYPTGEFSATRVRTVASLVPPVSDCDLDHALLWTETSYMKGQVPDSLRARIITSTLGSSNVPNSHKTPKARGRRGMTRYNKRLIVNSVTLLERRHGKETLSFLTLTLPSECSSLSPHLYAECKRQMLQWLQRSLARCGLPTCVIGCTEVQSRRLDHIGQFALHEHWIFKGREKYKGWALQPKAFAQVWIRILANVYKLGALPESACSSTRVESIRKSASAYLGKYVSKGEKCVQQMIQDGYEEFLPSSWVTKTREMLSMFRESIVKITGSRATFLSDNLREFRTTFCRWSKDLILDFDDGGSCWIGFTGYLNADGYKFLALTGT